jgi:Protein of unknown function (DUF1566)/EF hand
MKKTITIGCALCAITSYSQVTYPIVDTGQKQTFDNTREISYPKTNNSFYGQDAQYNGNQPKYRNNRNGTVTDLVTGLMWQQNPGSKKYYSQAVAGAKKCRTGGYKDWRLPTIKELYSLIDFSGTDIDPRSSSGSKNPFINKKYFKFNYGNTTNERIIDAQYATSTKYVSTTMDGNPTMFGVNFADGRIKGYPINSRKKYYVIYVRGNKNYGKNKFKDNGDGTITDKATGLTWTQQDSRKGVSWQKALSYANGLKFAGYSDWRLPNAKELQSIVDYTRSPDTTGSPAINPIFKVTAIKNEGGKKDYPSYWTSTTHKNTRGGDTAAYIAFGRALGFMRSRRTGNTSLMDVHGAGAQRSDPKYGNPDDFPTGRGPQGDVIRINNFVRLVRGGKTTINTKGPKVNTSTQSRSSRSNLQSDHFIKRLDKNGDGKVSKSEFDGPSRHFSHIDKNRDGYISSDEASSSPPPNRNNRDSQRRRR